MRDGGLEICQAIEGDHMSTVRLLAGPSARPGSESVNAETLAEMTLERRPAIVCAREIFITIPLKVDSGAAEVAPWVDYVLCKHKSLSCDS